MTNLSHLFISYATEDAVLATWLARKLANEGYAVWIDRLKLLGGEPWPRDIDVAIKERTFRMIALVSKHSLRKPNPSKERTLALSISRARGVPDFLVPLKLDSAELDWMTTDLTYIPFTNGWAVGWRQLLKKLRAVDAPRSLPEGASLAASSFDSGAELITKRTEQVFSNALPVVGVPDDLLVYRVRGGLLTSENLTDDRWATFQIDETDVVGFGPPSTPRTGSNWELKDRFAWQSADEYAGIPTSLMVRVLIERVVRSRLLNAGCLSHPKRKRTYYLRAASSKDGKLHFVGRSGKSTWCKIEGHTRVIRPGKPAEVFRHMFAFDVFRWHPSEAEIALQVRPSLVFTDKTGDLVSDDRVGPLRRRLTKNWWNHKWLNRLLAATDVVVKAQALPNDGLQLGDTLLKVDADTALDESLLARSPKDDLEESEVSELVEMGESETGDDH